MNTEDASPYAHHDEIWQLLPWYANGSLAEAEAGRVQAHVRVCLACRRELADQAALARRLRAAPPLHISPQPSFERLMARIRQDEQANAQAKRRAWFDGLWTAQPARLAAACTVGLLLFSVMRWIPGPARPSYHTVADAGSLDRFNAGDVRVVFAAQAKREDIDALLAEVQGRLLNGPSPSGAYTVSLGTKAMPQALSRLRNHPMVVFAEPALPPGTAQ